MKFTILKWSALMMTVVLAGCAQLTPVKYPESKWVKDYTPLLRGVTHFEVTGYAGVKTDTKSASANVDFTYKDGQYKVVLSGPIGAGEVILKKHPGLPIELARPDRPSQFASNASELMNKELGWSVPLNGLWFWLRGLPDPNMRYHTKLSDLGLLHTLYQDQWTIQYYDYSLVDDKYPVPYGISLKRPGLLIKIKIYHWYIHD